MQFACYGLLALAVCAVWMPTPRGRLAVPPWTVVFLAAVEAALAAGVIEFAALPWLAALGVLCWGAHRTRDAAAASLLRTLAALLAIALAAHRLPGFHNLPLFIDTRLSPQSAPFTQYLNFDKGAAGLLLLASFAPRCANREEWAMALRRGAPVLLVTALAVIAMALALGHVRPDPKFPAMAPTWLAANLLFTCVAEEAFFRGLLQEAMTRALARRGGRPDLCFWLPVAASALLFAAVHAAGGPRFVLLAALAGLGYAIAQARTRRIEAAILVHFGVNAVHFLGFTYPQFAPT